MKEIVTIDKRQLYHSDFSSLGASAKALYLYLAAAADEDGKIESIETAMKLANAKRSDIYCLMGVGAITESHGAYLVTQWN